jgi:hypothetical protein
VGNEKGLAANHTAGDPNTGTVVVAKHAEFVSAQKDRRARGGFVEACPGLINDETTDERNHAIGGLENLEAGHSDNTPSLVPPQADPSIDQAVQLLQQLSLSAESEIGVGLSDDELLAYAAQSEESRH